MMQDFGSPKQDARLLRRGVRQARRLLDGTGTCAGGRTHTRDLRSGKRAQGGVERSYGAAFCEARLVVRVRAPGDAKVPGQKVTVFNEETAGRHAVARR